ncbi:HAMP domain-containing histidine kinase [bacterium]|nr:HAMP domain-containing histidine kinase [bacterium]
MKNVNIKNFIDSSFSNYISKNTITGIISSILKPVACGSVKALILSRMRNIKEIDSLFRRLEYSEHINLKDLTNRDLLTVDEFKTVEFLLVTSARFNIFIAWDFEDSKNDKSKLFFLTNSRLINECFEIIKDCMKEDLSEEFYSYRPERRENILLNEVLTNIIDILNQNVQENEYMTREEMIIAQKLEKLDSLKEFSHEIKNQLSILEINSTLIDKKHDNIAELKTINKAIGIIKYNLGEIRNINKEEEKADIVEIIDTVISLSAENLKVKNNDIIFNDCLNREFKVAKEKIQGAILNIIQNANEAVENDKIEIILKEENNFVELYIANHGQPIEESVKSEIFNSGFTTKEEGWGIGLYISKKNIEKLGGEIRLNVSNNEKTEFLIKLPTAQNKTEIYY